jgi:hypothetical protein
MILIEEPSWQFLQVIVLFFSFYWFLGRLILVREFLLSLSNLLAQILPKIEEIPKTYSFC